MNDRLVIKKVIHTFSQSGTLLVDEIEVGVRDSLVPHGNVDMMMISCVQNMPPVCFFNFKEHYFYHCMSVSFNREFIHAIHIVIDPLY